MKDNEEEAEQEKMEMEGIIFPSLLPGYIPQMKPNVKLVKYLKDENYGTFTPLFLEKVLLEG